MKEKKCNRQKKIPKSSLHQKWAAWLLPSLTYKGLLRPNKKSCQRENNAQEDFFKIFGKNGPLKTYHIRKKVLEEGPQINRVKSACSLHLYTMSEKNEKKKKAL